MRPAPGKTSRPLPPTLHEYGIVGDLHSCALVSAHGQVDWLCFPRLDSPSIFAALLDPERGGHLRLRPTSPYTSLQSYEPRTNLLRTEFTTPTGTATLEAFMPVSALDDVEYAEHELHLSLAVTSGSIEAELEFAPRLDYGLRPTRIALGRHGPAASLGGEHVALSVSLPLVVADDCARGQWQGQAGATLGVVLRHGEKEALPYDAAEARRKRHETAAYWESWCSRGTYPYRSMLASPGDGGAEQPGLVPLPPFDPAGLQRSALALRLLTYAPTGALAAAATTSLPEWIGGTRNWDYRFSWVRDASFTVAALHGLGYAREARHYLRWLRRLLRGAVGNIGQLRVCYGLEGETELPEQELAHLAGYRGSRPVRIGNAAAQQFQLDIFGSLAHAIHLAYTTPNGHPDEAWRGLQAIADYVAEHWQEPDHGIWEVRGPKRRFTHSALMSWVALDRACQVAERRNRSARAATWQQARDAVRDAIETQGWSEERQSYAQSFGGHDLDAALLMVGLCGYLPPSHPRAVATVRAIEADLATGAFVHRYRSPDGIAGDEGAFLICSFWRVEALAAMGRIEEARRHYEALLAVGGPLGLFCEEVDVRTGEPLGNFPQALTHLAHIQAGLAIARAGEPHPPAARVRGQASALGRGAGSRQAAQQAPAGTAFTDAVVGPP